MNVRFSLVASAAVACAVITGCKAPKANVSNGSTASVRPARQTEVKTVEKESKPAPAVAETKKPEPLSCKCAPGTVHESPCKCGAPDCKCKVAAPEPEYTTYRVKGGDTLSGICATYGLINGHMNVEYIAELLEKRMPCYEQAKTVEIATDDKTPDEIAEKIFTSI